jgi:hypothetical protein
MTASRSPKAIMGCPVKLSPASGASWAERFLGDLLDPRRLRLRQGKAWPRKLVDFARALVEGADGRYFVTHATMRGPIDMADAMLGTEQLCPRLLTEPLAGAWKGVIQYSQLRIGEDVVVIGTGGIGLLCLMVAHKAGAGRLIAVDPSDYARNNAIRLGATHERFSLDGGYAHFMETRMDASFSVTPLSMMQSIRLQQRGLINTEDVISHRFPLPRIEATVAAMDGRERN